MPIVMCGMENAQALQTGLIAAAQSRWAGQGTIVFRPLNGAN